MVTYKHISKIIFVIMALAAGFCFAAVLFSDELEGALGGGKITMEYESRLFDTDAVIQVDIRMEEDDWNEMLENAVSEEYYACDAVINGQTFYSVGIRPKGNTSLSAIAEDPTTDRYSLKLEFDHYVSGQTCYGLDKLILNNNYADASNMKEAVVYDMYRYLEADASLCNYAEIHVNGEYWGIYLALEAVEDSFMLRNYGTEDGNLYKPESMDKGGGFGQDGFSGMKPDRGKEGPALTEPGGMRMDGMQERPGNGEPPDAPHGAERGNMPEGDAAPPDVKEGTSGEFSGKNGGADLNYTDDELDSYSIIWEGEVTDSGKQDHKRVIQALKNIAEGTRLETYLNIDNVLKYMAVHTFSVNLDSLSGNMAHNYYLYEYGGQLNILPWDYNLSFGGMDRGEEAGASSVINDAIDTPFSGTDFFDALLENEEYQKRYHEYLQKLTDEYVNGGVFEQFYLRTRSQNDALVEADPTAFYSADEYDAGAKMLYDTVLLRAESIQGQLDGSIPSTDEGQREDASSLIDASGIDIDTMGVFQRGKK